ncbi:hypothetical protein N1M2_209 [Klebsiella phage N1M2]|uniref:Uncharacterized protein n=1 Tax=Klebsiella phage N1M2 TaxID=2664939 RepID=A0A6B7ZFA6_9CAUD|nr:hypothetical protein PQB72_gp209 [Klebsiella phage N1M2]QGH72072.1 hypothetical protein N1M2_209 [Klebsiella phage N1M2]
MNEKEFEFESDNHYNLYAFAELTQKKVFEDSAFKVENQDYHDRYKVSLGGYIWYVAAKFIGKFWLMLEQCEYQQLEAIIAEEKDVKEGPYIPYEKITGDVDMSGPFYELVGEDFISVENRMSGLVKAVAQNIRETATIINEEMELVAKDGDIVKDFDGYVTFDTKLGLDFNVGLCFDKIKPIAEDNASAWIERTPITQEYLDTYFPNAGKRILGKLDQVNSLVKALFESKTVTRNPELVEYAGWLVTGTLVNAYLNQNVTYISFGGKDNWSVLGKETKNNLACFKYLDQEVEYIIKMLDGIEKTDGVDIYSMDIDTFAVFGRNFDNKVVTEALQGYVQPLLDKYSKGFEQCLATRMAMIDNQHFFKA